MGWLSFDLSISVIPFVIVAVQTYVTDADFRGGSPDLGFSKGGRGLNWTGT